MWIEWVAVSVLATVFVVRLVANRFDRPTRPSDGDNPQPRPRERGAAR